MVKAVQSMGTVFASGKTYTVGLISFSIKIESVTLIQLQHKGGTFKGPAKGQCLNCMDKQEYDLTIPVNRGDLINIKRPERR